VVVAYGWFYDRVAAVKADSLAEIKQRLEPLQTKATELQKHEDQIKKTKQELDAFSGWLQQRFFWPDVLTEIRKILMVMEVSLTRPGVQVGIWIEQFGNVAHDTGVTYTREPTTEPEQPSP